MFVNANAEFIWLPAPVKCAEFHEFPVRRVRVNVSTRGLELYADCIAIDSIGGAGIFSMLELKGNFQQMLMYNINHWQITRCKRIIVKSLYRIYKLRQFCNLQNGKGKALSCP